MAKPKVSDRVKCWRETRHRFGEWRPVRDGWEVRTCRCGHNAEGRHPNMRQVLKS